METLPNSTLLRGLRFENLIAYLELTDWKFSETSNERWLVFEGASDIEGKPLEIVLPRDSSAPDLKIYLASAVNLLSAVTDDLPENVVKKIKYYDRDVLSVRILETGEEDSITLRLAAKQVSQLRQLVAFAANSEQEPRPHFNTQWAIAKRIIERYRFGHTFPGSFGFTVESPIIGQPTIVEQHPLLPDVEKLVISPLERRVMERIVRGLLITQQATAEQDIQTLVKGYENGFNANMCEAVVRMSRGKTLPLEYTVLWSPKMGPSPDIDRPGTIRLRERSYQYLEDASRELRELEPEYVTIRGRVTDLSSRGNPLEATGIPRSVAITWTNRPGKKRPVRVIVSPLKREDYFAAIDAHSKWNTVEVTGIIQRVGYIWRLSEPHDFKVVW